MRRGWLFLLGVLRPLTWARRAPRHAAALGAVAAGIVLVTSPAMFQIAPRLVWNASASAPIGLYWAAGRSQLNRGDLALAELPELVRQLASARGYLPPGIPLVKHIAAIPGDHICTIGRAVLIGGEVVARRQKRDTKGRLMPAWSGCRLLTSGEIFLLNGEVRDSFDGRYFGPTRMDEVIGRLVPLWIWSDRQK